LTTKILETYKQDISSLTLVPAAGGCFELSLGGDLLYSKLDTGNFPDEDTMVELIGQRLGAKA
jgi:selenoprotein W-related protein